MDSSIVLWLNGWGGRSFILDAFMEAFVSDYLAPVFISLVLLTLWFHGACSEDRIKNQLTTIAGTMSVGFANLLVSVVNLAMFRDRPFVDLDVTLHFYAPTDSSFPANIAAVGFAVATVVLVRHRALGLALYGVAAMWGIARVYAGVHYPSDILAGAGLGLAAAVGAIYATRALGFVLLPMLRIFRFLYVA